MFIKNRINQIISFSSFTSIYSKIFFVLHEFFFFWSIFNSFKFATNKYNLKKKLLLFFYNDTLHCIFAKSKMYKKEKILLNKANLQHLRKAVNNCLQWCYCTYIQVKWNWHTKMLLLLLVVFRSVIFATLSLLVTAL